MDEAGDVPLIVIAHITVVSTVDQRPRAPQTEVGIDLAEHGEIRVAGNHFRQLIVTELSQRLPDDTRRYLAPILMFRDDGGNPIHPLATLIAFYLLGTEFLDRMASWDCRAPVCTLNLGLAS